MNPLEAELERAYAEWRRLAEAEGSAIRAGRWNLVAECQQAIAQLPSTIDQLNARMQREPGSKTPGPRKLVSRATVLELIELQKRNLASLQQRRERLSAHVQNLAQAGRNLRGIQRSYRQAVPSAWNSYS